MSIKNAIEIIKPRLTVELQTAIVKALEADASSSKVSIPYFLIERVPSFEGVKHTNERRLVGCTDAIREKCIRDRLALMNESLAAGSTQHLWFGYIVGESERSFFMVDEKRNVYCIGPYP
jgi:hypothetical protein